jgi:hypothetical protein
MTSVSGNSPEAIWTAFFEPWSSLKNSHDTILTALTELNFPKRWKKNILKNVKSGQGV